jgi:hypothetical protein
MKKSEAFFVVLAFVASAYGIYKSLPRVAVALTVLMA